MHTEMNDQHDSAALRQALAMAIVRNKRRCDQEAAEWRAKSQRLEQELQAERDKQEQLQQWVTAALQQQQQQNKSPSLPEQSQPAQESEVSIFLPPLSAAGGGGDGGHESKSQMQPAGNFQGLQQQVALAAAAAGDTYSAVADVLDGKAAALSSMLLTNVQMLQQLSGKQPSPAIGSCAAEAAATISNFITRTLLRAPRSLLSSAYMKQSAAVLAAVLAAPAPSPANTSAATPGDIPQCVQQADSPEALALQVVQLMLQLLAFRAAAGSDAAATPSAESGAGSSCAAAGPGTAATLMLQQLSVFPGTALLLCLAAAQRVQGYVQELQEANAAVQHISLASFGACAAAAEQALRVASQAFQASLELLADLESTVLRVPALGIALADSTWTPRALEDLVASATALYQACAELRAQQPLLVGRICSLCANLATALQQLAANGDAPGMRAGMGAELRSVAGGLCVKLRDVFMPIECS